MNASQSHKPAKPAPARIAKSEHGSNPPIHGTPSGGMTGASTTPTGISGGISAPLPKGHDGKVKISGGIG